MDTLVSVETLDDEGEWREAFTCELEELEAAIAIFIGFVHDPAQSGIRIQVSRIG